MANFRSTFPLDESAVARKALTKIMTDPITWVPLVPAVAAYTIFDIPALVSLGLGALVLGVVGAYWRKQWHSLLNGVRRDSVVVHNRSQDAVLKAAADELRMAGSPGYANQLEKFLKIKQQVEARVHEDGEITPQKIQIEQLVDALCFGVRDQLTTLLARERKGETVDRKAALAQVDAALTTLQSTAVELDTILGPGSPPADASGSSLEEITRRLREEGEIARRVQARLRGEMSAPPQPESRGMETEG